MTNIKLKKPISSNIAAVGYQKEADEPDGELFVEFTSGGVYVYSGVPEDASDGGQYFARHIRVPEGRLGQR